MTNWVLALSFWLHMLATIVWVGGLALMALVVWPGARAVLGPGPQLAELLRRLQRRFNPWAWGSLAVLTVTGLTQMAANENYDGMLQVSNPWALAILVKHIAVGGMVLDGLYSSGRCSRRWCGWRPCRPTAAMPRGWRRSGCASCC